MEGTTPNNTNQNNLDEVINELFESAVESGSEKDLETALRLIDAWNNDFTGEGEDITDKLPSLSEALQQREQIEKLQIENEKLNSGYSDIWHGVFNILDDAGIDATSPGKLIGGVRTLKEENEKLQKRQLPFGWTIESVKNLQEERDEFKEKYEEQEYWETQYHDLKLKVDWGTIEDYSARIDELIDKNNKQKLRIEELEAENQKFTSEIEMYGHPELLYKKSEKYTEAVKELACVRSQMDDEEERMKGFVNINTDGNGELPKEEEVKDCLGCRFARFREFHHTMWEDFQKEMFLHEGAKTQIPEKKGKRMTRADKVLLRDAWEDVKDRWGVAMAAVEDIENSPEGEKFKEKMALFARLLK